MSDNHNAYLKAMDIDVWVERTPSVPASVVPHEKITQQTSQTEQKQINPVHVPIPEPTSETESSLTEVETLNWHELQSTVAECQLCGLAKTRAKTIIGSGKQTSSLMVIGGAISKEDEQVGEPFSGKAGKLLTAMLKAMGFQRNDVFISNIVKCHNTENQDPSIEEVAACEPYLLRQINLLQPDLILVLGSVTAQRLLKSKSTMSRLRGQLHYIEGIDAPVIVSFEPDYLLRSPNEKRKAWEDLQMAMKELSKISASKK